VITRWQAARGYPKSGYLNKLQHKALPERDRRGRADREFRRGAAQAPRPSSGQAQSQPQPQPQRSA